MVENNVIKSATVYFSGDPSVGIFPASYELEVWIDMKCFAENELKSYLAEIRAAIANTYEIMLGEKVYVMFDFEIEEENRREDLLYSAYREYEDNLSDVEADSMTLRDAGMGTDEDYGPSASEII